ncbi:MAG: diguanylate cyclase [Myxococcota bacterium]
MPHPSIGPDDLLGATERLSRIGHWSYDLTTGEVRWSDRIFEIYGYVPGSVTPTYELAVEVFDAKERAIFEAHVQAAIAHGTPYQLHLSMTAVDGTHRVMHAAGEARRGPEGEVAGLYGIVEDVTERVDNRNHLLRFQSVVDTMREGVIIADKHGKITWVNEAFSNLSGYRLEDVVGKTPGTVLQGPATDPKTTAMMRENIRAGRGFTTEVLNYSKFGDPYWLKLSVVPRVNEDGEVIEFFGLEIDITEQRETQATLEKQRSEMELTAFKLSRQQRELRRLTESQRETLATLESEIERRKELEDELRRLATTDELCGVANRRELMRMGEQEIQRCVRYDRPLSVVCFDIDHFKQVNDVHGHTAGDIVLRQVAQTVSAGIRAVDVVARTGGEEFVILLPETDVGGASRCAEHARARIEETSCLAPSSSRALSVSASFGVAALAAGEDLSSLLNRADTALYRAKRSGRNRVCVCDETERGEAPRAAHLRAPKKASKDEEAATSKAV